MKITANDIKKIHSLTSEREYAIDRLKALREPPKPFQHVKVIFEPGAARSFVEEGRFGTDLGARLHGTMLIYFQGVIERVDRELLHYGVEIEEAA